MSDYEGYGEILEALTAKLAAAETREKTLREALEEIIALGVAPRAIQGAHIVARAALVASEPA